MNLITFAHRGEARHFLKSDSYAQAEFETSSLFKNENSYLLITGEGIESTTKRMNIFFQKKNEKISKVINIGIAGALDENLKLESIHSVRDIFSEKEDETFQSSDVYAKVDCISALGKVQNQEYKNKLKNSAQIVDLELWAIAKICRNNKIPVYSIKLISDFADSNVDIKNIIKKSKKYSKHLYEFYLKYMAVKD